MKSGHEYGFTEDQQNRIFELMRECDQPSCFEIAKTIYFGELVEVVKRYVGQNPSDKFVIWLDKNIPHIQKDQITKP